MYYHVLQRDHNTWGAFSAEPETAVIPVNASLIPILQNFLHKILHKLS